MTILSLICKNCLKPLTKMDELGLELCIRCDKIELEAKEPYLEEEEEVDENHDSA